MSIEGKIGEKDLKRSTTVENSLQINPFYAKQSQFDGGQNEHKLRYEKQLQDIVPLAQAKKQTQFKPNKAKNKPNLTQNKPNSNPIQSQFVERPKMMEFTLDVSSLALEFTLGCAYLFFCRGSGAVIHKSGRLDKPIKR